MHRVGYIIISHVTNLEIMFFPYLELTPTGREAARNAALDWVRDNNSTYYNNAANEYVWVAAREY